VKAVVPKRAPVPSPEKAIEHKAVAKATAKTAPLATGKVKSEHGAVTIPQRAGDLKARFSELANATNQIKGLKRAFQKNFYEVGEILAKVQSDRLFEVKGYGSFESFVEREIDLGTQLCLSATRIFQTLQRDAALAAGLERASAAVAALDGATEPRESARVKHNGMYAVPIHKQ
jgi:tellurite resistance protein